MTDLTLEPPHRQGGIRPSTTLAGLRASRIIGYTLAKLVSRLPEVVTRRPMPRRVTREWHARVCRLAGVDVQVHGAEPAKGPTIFVANHVSYIDIIALGGLIDCSFVAKAEVAGWPIFGYLSKLQRTVFVERRARRAAGQRDELRSHLEKGESLILFPEGTSSDGSRVLPFKSSLFEAANAECDGEQVWVQPVSIAYSRFDNIPMERWIRPYYAWYGDMEMGGHLWHWLGLGKLGVDVILHEPVRLGDFKGRKELARHCEMAVDHGVTQVLNNGLADVGPVAALPSASLSENAK
ncbi:lysophospholipid acyltransferase family protein [Aestuariispira ectoiniformans]|uniref:lysophospholipid acyltransferase family protein n=1 Tax=Aestuariispira ectoiniformans TaxID=2775080 RepID=UPI00223BD85E|nr:lysophospholipid acyltransferase family protein [Aestuariispira ectoiniformans]